MQTLTSPALQRGHIVWCVFFTNNYIHQYREREYDEVGGLFILSSFWR